MMEACLFCFFDLIYFQGSSGLDTRDSFVRSTYYSTSSITNVNSSTTDSTKTDPSHEVHFQLWYFLIQFHLTMKALYMSTSIHLDNSAIGFMSLYSKDYCFSKAELAAHLSMVNCLKAACTSLLFPSSRRFPYWIWDFELMMILKLVTVRNFKVMMLKNFSMVRMCLEREGCNFLKPFYLLN